MLTSPIKQEHLKSYTHGEKIDWSVTPAERDRMRRHAQREQRKQKQQVNAPVQQSKPVAEIKAAVLIGADNPVPVSVSPEVQREARRIYSWRQYFEADHRPKAVFSSDHQWNHSYKEN